MLQLKNVPSICSSVISCDSLSSNDEKFILNEKYNQKFPDDISLSSIEDAEFTAAEDYKGKVIAQTDLTHNHKVLIMWWTSELAEPYPVIQRIQLINTLSQREKNANKITLSKIEIIRQIQQVRLQTQ